MKKIIITAIIFLLFGAIIGCLLIGNLGNQLTPANSSQTNNLNCAPVPLHYELAVSEENNINNNNKPMEFSVDLNGDGVNEIVKFYREISSNYIADKFPIRSLPIIMKVYSDDDGCFKELYSYTADHNKMPDNEMGVAEVISNFWEDGKNIVLFDTISTAYGSGYTTSMKFLTFDLYGYRVVDGPQIGSISSYRLLKKNSGINILVSRGEWGSTENHFGSHIQKLEMWEWNEGEYVIQKLGMTKNRYEKDIDNIISGEPHLLKDYKSIIGSNLYTFGYEDKLLTKEDDLLLATFTDTLIKQDPSLCKRGQEENRDTSGNIFSVDLEDDGNSEHLFFPFKLCGTQLVGANGNGFFFIFQKSNGSWVSMGKMYGSSYLVDSTKVDGYKSIKTNWLEGPVTANSSYHYDITQKKYITTE